MAAIGFFALHSCTPAVDHTIDHVATPSAEVLHVQPQVTVNQRVVLTQTAPIAELAVVTKEELVTIGFNEHLEVLSVQIPLTEKKLTAEATYRLKAGFDLREPFSVDDRSGHARAPGHDASRENSVGRTNRRPDLSRRRCLLNRVTDDERTQILSNLNAAAHDAAEKSSLKADAEQQVTAATEGILEP